MKNRYGITGQMLNDQWNIGASQSLFSKDGKWYMRLERFPGALCDYNGYLLFRSEEEYEKCEYLRIGVRTHVAGEGISSMPGYKRMK